MSPECSKHQVLSFVKMLVVNEQKNKIKNKKNKKKIKIKKVKKKYFVLISVLQSAQ